MVFVGLVATAGGWSYARKGSNFRQASVLIDQASLPHCSLCYISLRWLRWQLTDATAVICHAVQDAAGWLQGKQDQQDHQQQQPTVQHPRHARVNLLKATVQDVLAQLQDSSSGGGSGYDVHVDDLLPDLLVFLPGTDLHDHPLVEQGVLILQVRIDKCKA